MTGDFGLAMRLQSDEGWAIGFYGPSGLEICGPFAAEIRSIQSHVLWDRSGILLDETDPTDPLLFRNIYFCEPGHEPIDLLSGQGRRGRLLTP